MTITDKACSRHPVIVVSRCIFRALKWVTFGKCDIRYDERTTTIGSTMYTGSAWHLKGPASRDAEIMHEAEHVRQWRTWWILYPITYLLSVWSIVLPVVLLLLQVPTLWALLIGITAGCLLPGPSLRAYWEYKAFRHTIIVLCDRRYITGGLQAGWYAKMVAGMPYYYAGLCFERLIRRKYADLIGRLL